MLKWVAEVGGPHLCPPSLLLSHPHWILSLLLSHPHRWHLPPSSLCLPLSPSLALSPSLQPSPVSTTAGGTEPTWNDKFVIRIDDATLRSNTSGVTFDVYVSRSSFHPRRDTLIGTARAVLSTLRLVNCTRFVALQVCRPASLRPQGMLNVGVSLRLHPVHAALLWVWSICGTCVGGPGCCRRFYSRRWVVVEGVEVGERRGTVAVGRRTGEREQAVVESKLEKWRTQLSPLKDREDDEKGSPVGGSGAGRGRGRGRGRGMGKRMRSFGRMACFVDVDDAGDVGGERRRM